MYRTSCVTKSPVVAILLATVGLSSLTCAVRCPGQTQPPVATSRAGEGRGQVGATDLASLRAIGQSVVLVAVRFNGEIHGVPGVVFHRTGDQALVAARRPEELERIYSNSRRVVSGPDYFVLWSEGGQRKSVRAERVSALERSALCVVGAPADQLPPPIKIDAAPELTPQMPVSVIGYETNWGVRPAAFAGFAEQGILSRIERDENGQVKTIEMDCTEAPALSLAVVATPSGQVVGFCWGSRSNGAADGSQFVVSPPSSLTQLLEPQIAFLQFGFESGDTKQVVYEFVAVVNDPCHQISEARLSIQPQFEKGPLVEDFREPIAGPGERPPIEEPPPIDTLPDATTLELVRQAPSNAFMLQYSWIERYGDGHTWVARFPGANPGQKREYVFRGQLSYTDKSGTKIYMPPRRLDFSVQFRKGDAVPAIPGIDGKPIDCPRPVRLADGSYRVTSECTRVDPDTTDVEVEVPQPVQSGKVLASKVPGVGGRRAVALDVAPAKKLYNLGVPAIPAVFSPDGAWLYLVDANSVIRKISTTDFTEQVYLETGASCTSLGYSRAGLVAAIEDARLIYVLDPASLKVKRAIPTDGVRMIAASPATDIGFAEGRVETGEPGRLPRAYTQLLMLDFGTGRKLHRIKNGQGPYLQIGTTDFDLGLGTPYLSPDGKYLYLSGHPADERLHRFRVEGEDLIYERAFEFFPCFMGEGTVVSQKGQFRSYFVHDLEQADQPKFEIDLNAAGPSAVDPKSGSVYFLDPAGSMHIFDSTGKNVASFVVSGVGVSYLLPHPGGQRLLGWGEKKILYYDLELGRLPEAVGGGDVSSPDDAISSSPVSGELRPLTPGNLVASIRTSSEPLMFELDPRGGVVQSIVVPKPPDAESVSDISDLVVASDGSLYVMLEYKRTSTIERQSCVAVLGTDREQWRFRVLPCEKQSSFASTGDIELREDGTVAVLVNRSEAFLFDPRSASDAPIPIPSGMCMTFGPDGTYYTSGVDSEWKTISVYDLKSLRKIREFKADQEPTTIAIDKDGSIYMAHYTTVTKILPNGSTKRLDVSKNWSADAINDIDLSSDGILAVGSRSGKLFTVDRDLSPDSLFVSADDDLAGWVAWIPEPSKPESPPTSSQR